MGWRDELACIWESKVFPARLPEETRSHQNKKKQNEQVKGNYSVQSKDSLGTEMLSP